MTNSSIDNFVSVKNLKSILWPKELVGCSFRLNGVAFNVLMLLMTASIVNKKFCSELKVSSKEVAEVLGRTNLRKTTFLELKDAILIYPSVNGKEIHWFEKFEKKDGIITYQFNDALIGCMSGFPKSTEI